MSYPINTPNSHWPQFSQWLSDRNLQEGVDFTLQPFNDLWTIINFAREQDHWDFAVFGSQFTYNT